MTGGNPLREAKRKIMAHDEEPLLANPPTHEVGIHVRDYERFTTMFKWAAVVALIVGLIVLMILSS
jgi:hypothetical protein